jgi:hypothetical protein
VKDRTIQRDGGRNVLLLDQLRNECVDRRHLKSDADTENRGEQNDVPDLDGARPDQQAQGNSRHDLDHLGGDQDHAFVVTIRSRPADHG